MAKLQGKTATIIGAKYLGLSYALVVLGCTSARQQSPAPDTRTADEATIRKADADWAAAAQSKQVAAWVAFYSEDAVVLPPNEKGVSTLERRSTGRVDGCVAGPFRCGRTSSNQNRRSNRRL